MAPVSGDRRSWSDEELDAAVQALTEPDRLDHAQHVVARVAPGLQRVLAEALDAGDWFGSAHRAEVLRAAGTADPDERVVAVNTLIAEETRMSMLVGVAVGLELARELAASNPEPMED